MSQIFTKIGSLILRFVQNMHHKVVAKLGLKTYLTALHCFTIKVPKGQNWQTYRLFAKTLRKSTYNAMRVKLYYIGHIVVLCG